MGLAHLFLTLIAAADEQGGADAGLEVMQRHLSCSSVDLNQLLHSATHNMGSFFKRWASVFPPCCSTIQSNQLVQASAQNA